jgi:hypothetical protein
MTVLLWGSQPTDINAHVQADTKISDATLIVLLSPHCDPFQLQIFSYWCNDINLPPFVLNYFRFPSLQAIQKVCSDVENCRDSEVLTSVLMDANRTGNISRIIALDVHELSEILHSMVYHKLKCGPITSWPFLSSTYMHSQASSRKSVSICLERVYCHGRKWTNHGKLTIMWTWTFIFVSVYRL